MELAPSITAQMVVRTTLRGRIGSLDLMRVISQWESVQMTGSRNDILAVGRSHRIEYKLTTNPPKVRKGDKFVTRDLEDRYFSSAQVAI